MAPLMQNMSQQDVQWAKFKSSYMWNKIYYLRRTKFVVYQLTSTSVNIVLGLGISVLREYSNLQSQGVADFPHANIHTSNIIDSLAVTVVSSVSLALIFGTAVLFDLFWPERKEAFSIQWTWKLSAVFSTIFHMAALIAITIVIATSAVHISGVSVEQENAILGNWNGPSLQYSQNSRALATVVIGWVTWVFAFWSTLVLWRCYTHNNKHGPFAEGFCG